MSTDTQSARGPLAKLRSTKGSINASSNSLASSSGDGDESGNNEHKPQSLNATESGGLRASVGSAIDKVKDRTRRLSVDGQVDGRGSEDSTRLSSIITRTKRRVRNRSKAPGGSRRGSVDSRLGNDLELEGNQSESSLFAGSGRSSLLTDDERSEDG